MKYYLIAGERSGDLHGSNLIRAIRQHDPSAEFRAWGGEQMQAAGATIVTHYADMAFMGFWEVIKNIFTIRTFLKKCKADLLDYKPDAIILIDYAGFNMRMAEFAHQNGIKTLYYISPKVWAWNQKRALKIKRFVDKLYVIFPFEQSFFKQFDYEVEYVGNPLLDAVAQFKANPNFKTEHQLTSRPIVALLPGSRKQEVEKMLPLMVKTSSQFTDYQFIVAGVSNLPQTLYSQILEKSDVKIVYDAAYDLLSVATAALVTSGTATLDTALFDVPQVVCYKANWISYQIGKAVIKVPYISLVNLVAEKEVVKELIQNELTLENLKKELNGILPKVTPVVCVSADLNDRVACEDIGHGREKQLNDYANMKTRLGSVGASQRAGKLMVEFLLKLNKN